MKSRERKTQNRLLEDYLKRGKLIDARRLLDAGFTVRKREAKSIMSRASRDVVIFLLEHLDFDFTKIFESEYMLSISVDKGDSKLVELLLQHGAHPDQADEYGFCDFKTPIGIAIEKGYHEILELLLDAGADTEIWCDRIRRLAPIHLAIKAGNMKIIKMLIDRKCNISPECLRSTLHMVLRVTGRSSVMNVSLGEDLPYDVLPPETDKKSERKRRKYLSLAKLLISGGADLNRSTGYGHCLLHLAVRIEGSQEIMKLSLDNGADIEEEGKDGARPLHEAAAFHNAESVKLLLEAGANIEAKSKGCTPYMIARYFNDIDYCHEAARLIGVQMLKYGAAGLYNEQQSIAMLTQDIERIGIDDFLDLDENDPLTLEEYLSTLRQEVELMENSMLTDSTSLYDIFTKRIPNYLENVELVDRLNSIDYEKFPEFSQLIRERIKIDKKNHKLMADAKYCLLELIQQLRAECEPPKPTLPQELCEKIFSYLNTQDLHNLVRCRRAVTSRRNGGLIY